MFLLDVKQFNVQALFYPLCREEAIAFGRPGRPGRVGDLVAGSMSKWLLPLPAGASQGPGVVPGSDLVARRAGLFAARLLPGSDV